MRKARQFDENQFGYFEENDTVFLPSDSTYHYNGETLPVTVQNTQRIFGAAKVIITPALAGHSISLNGDIGINYYLRYPKGTEIHFEWYNKTYDHTITDADFDASNGAEKYGLLVDLIKIITVTLYGRITQPMSSCLLFAMNCRGENPSVLTAIGAWVSTEAKNL